MYATLKATVRQGKIELLDNFTLPENVTLLVTVLEDSLPEQLTLSAHLQRGLNDILHQRTTVVRSERELKNHLDAVFGQD
jgi:hypothetical protein